MNKNFFKKLSFVLALAMIVSIIAPAAGAFAATSPSLNATSKTLLLGQDGRDEFDFGIKNKVAGSAYKWTSTDENVAIVDEATGLTSAVGVGKATVSVVITKKGSKAKTLKATVVVKSNIKTVTISNAPAKAVAVNAEYDFARSYVTFSGAKSGSTSITRWIVSDATNASIVAESGLFKATKAGKYTVTALAFQSKAKYDAWKALNDPTSTVNVLDTDAVEVTVAPSMVSAKQKDLDTVEVKFDSAMTDVDKNISFYAIVGTSEVKVNTVKAVKLSDDKLTATVDFYVPLTQGSEYVVKYTDLQPVKFTAAKADADKVTSMTVNTTEAVLNKSTAIAVSLFDVNGVDITTDALKTKVDFEVTSNRVIYDKGTKSITIFTKGEVAPVTATFHSYKWDTTGKEIGNITATGSIIGVDAASTVVGSTKAWTILGLTDTPNYKDVKQKLAANDTNKRLFVQLATKTGTTDSTMDSSVSGSQFKFESSDKTILYVTNSGALYPYKAGVVTIVVKVDDKVVDAITITVNDERKAVAMELGKDIINLSNSVNVLDSDSATVKVKDQLGDEMTLKDFKAEKLSGPDGSSDISVLDTANKKVTFNGAGAKDGTYQYKVLANGLVRVINVVVAKPTSDTPSSYALTLSTKDADSKSTNDNARPTVTINLFGMAGTKTSKPSITGSTFKVVVKDPDSKETTLTSNNFDLTSLSGSALSKVKNGTYTVTAFELKSGSWVAVAYDYFAVKDTQVTPVLAEVKSLTYSGTDTNAIARACFKVTLDGKDVTDFITMDASDFSGDINSYIYVKTVKYTETIGAYTYTHTIDVKYGINVK